MCFPCTALYYFVLTFPIESFQLWEIVTLGDSPYRGLPFEELCEWLRSGRRMERPRACPEALFEVRKSRTYAVFLINTHVLRVCNPR